MCDMRVRSLRKREVLFGGKHQAVGDIIAVRRSSEVLEECQLDSEGISNLLKADPLAG